ncbi:MAG TPA: 2'-5' RNA ligase family protein [Gaiellaceae bacterium]|nr:2'-5' RNA ligase family protein [Gaiellaceae bacterium]
MPRTALIIEVPEAEPAIGALRLEHDPSAAQGVGAHITILYPFADPVDEDAVAELFARFRPFDFTLDRVERFEDGAVWLRPTPPARFVDLTAAVVQRWPEHPPYEGAFDEPIPHLTVSTTPIDFDVQLPIASHAHEVTLIEQGQDGHWSVVRRFPLGSGVAAHAVE